jgi:excisionase family DNA binding protein
MSRVADEDGPRGSPALPVIAMSMDDAAKSLGVSKPTVYALEREGRLRTFAIGRRRLVSPEALRECVRLLEQDEQ